jgi:hypothetical protein
VLAHLKPLLWPLVVAALAAALYLGRISSEMVDFDVYRSAAERVLAAESLYQAEDGHYAFKYLPAFAFAMTPFALVHPDTARAIWYAFSVGLLLAFLRWSVSALPARRRPDRVLTWLAFLFMAKFYAHELLLGQANLLLGALLVASLLAAQIDQPRVAAILIALAAFVKPYALLLLPWLVVSHGAAAGAIGAAVLAAGLLLPALVYGWGGNLALLGEWRHAVLASTVPNLTGADNVSLAAMWAKWLGPGATASTLALLTAVAALGVVAAIWLRRRAMREPDYLEVALLMLLIPLLSPQGWDYVLLLATPAVICVLDRWRDVTVPWRVFTGAALGLMGLTFFDVLGRALYARFMALSVITVCALGLAAALAHLRRCELA